MVAFSKLRLTAGLLIAAALTACGGSAVPPAAGPTTSSAAAKPAAPASEAAAPAPAQAGQLKAVTVLLSWPATYQPHHMPFWLGKAKGMFAKHGFDLTIQGVNGAPQVIQLMTAGKAQFGLGSAVSLIQAVAKQHPPLKMVAMEQQIEVQGLKYYTSSGMKSPKDLEGKTIGLTTGSMQLLLWPAFAKAAGVDASKVKLVNTDFQTYNRLYAEGKFAATVASLGEASDITDAQSGHPDGQWTFGKFLPLLGQGIIVPDSLVKSDPQEVRSFVQAWQEAMAEILKDPKAAVNDAADVIEQNVNGAPSKDLVVQSALEVIPDTFVSEDTKGKPTGWMNPDDWSKMIDLLAQYDSFPSKPAATDLFTNQFVQ